MDEDKREQPSGSRDDRSRDVEPTEAEAGSASAGDYIGPYRLLQRLGEGGMGEVWLAEQQKSVRRRVALKIIKRGLETKAVVTRFEAERQALSASPRRSSIA